MPKRPRAADLSVVLGEAADGVRKRQPAAPSAPALGAQAFAPVPRSGESKAGPRRAGTVALTVHVTPETRASLKILAAQQGITLHALVCRGLNATLAEAGLPEIAD